MIYLLTQILMAHLAIYIWVCLEMGYTLRNGPDKYHRESDHTPSIFSVSPSIVYQTQRRLSQPQIGIRPTQNGFLICFNMF